MAISAFCPTLITFAPSLSLHCKRRTQSSYQQSQTTPCWSSSSLRLLPVSSSRFLSSILPHQQRDVSHIARSLYSTEAVTEDEEVFFDGGVHYGDLLTNLVFGLSLVWLPLTLAAVFRSLFLRYRFTNVRITIQSGLLGNDRKDFWYEVVKDVKIVPRFIGEWGDMAIELKDGTKVDLRCVPKFREISRYVQERAGQKNNDPAALSSTVTTRTSKKGFS